MSWEWEEKSAWWIMRNCPFYFYWFPRVGLGIYKTYHDGWHFTINLGVCSLCWSDA
jgi:hypothetical protein